MADGHISLAPNADRFISRPRLVRTSSLPDLSKVHTDSTLVFVDRISNENMSTSWPIMVRFPRPVKCVKWLLLRMH